MYTLPDFIQDARGQYPEAHPENRPPNRDISRITIISDHYDAEFRPPRYDAAARIRGQANYHINKGWGQGGTPPYGFGLMYHIVIEDQDDSDSVAEAYMVNGLERVLWNVTNANYIACAVRWSCGNGQEPTEPMKALGKRVNEWLLSVLPNTARARVFGHGELTQYGNSTNCPGAVLPWCKKFREGEPAPVPAPNTQFFPETGHTVGNAFLDYFNGHGGLARFGFPISEELPGQVGEWSGTIQWFERARFEWHTESGQGQVMLGRIGAEAFEHFEHAITALCASS